MTLNQCRRWAGGEAENEPHFSGAEATQPRVSHGGENWIRMSQQGRTAAPEGGGECPHGGEHQPRMSQHRRTPAQDVPTGHCCNPAHFPFWGRVLLPLVCFLEWGLFFFLGLPRLCFQAGSGIPHGVHLFSEHPGSSQQDLAWTLLVFHSPWVILGEVWVRIQRGPAVSCSLLIPNAVSLEQQHRACALSALWDQPAGGDENPSSAPGML